MFEGIVRMVRQLFHISGDTHSQVRQEMLVRNQAYKHQYSKWIKQYKQVEIIKNLYTSFTLTKLGIAGEIPMHQFIEGNRSFLVIHYIESIGKDIFSFLQDYFRDRIQRIGYTVYLSDRKIVERLGYIEITERHILKPQSSTYSMSTAQEQLYGNVFLIIHYINERPLYMEVVTEELSGNYAEALPFDELAEIIFI